MKTKTMVVYYFPLVILLLLTLALRDWASPEPVSVKVCKQYAGCEAVSMKVQNWLDFR